MAIIDINFFLFSYEFYMTAVLITYMVEVKLISFFIKYPIFRLDKVTNSPIIETGVKRIWSLIKILHSFFYSCHFNNNAFSYTILSRSNAMTNLSQIGWNRMFDLAINIDIVKTIIFFSIKPYDKAKQHFLIRNILCFKV